MTGRGIKPTNSRGSGHQYVHFQVVIPRALSAEQRALLEQLRDIEDKLGDEERTARSPQ